MRQRAKLPVIHLPNIERFYEEDVKRSPEDEKLELAVGHAVEEAMPELIESLMKNLRELLRKP